MKKKIENIQALPGKSKPKHRKTKSISNNPVLLEFQNQELPKKSPQVNVSKIISQKTNKKTHRRTVSENLYLAPLKGNQKIKVPKVYKNQIFTDIYDEFGNHDRILETVESIEVYQEVSKGCVLTFNKSDISTEKFIQPYNSFNSIEVTSKNLKDELFQKLQKLSEQPKNRDRGLAMPITLGRNKNTAHLNFFFQS